MSIMCFVGLDMLMGLDTPKLIVPTEFKVFDLFLKYMLGNVCIYIRTYDCPSACLCPCVHACSGGIYVSQSFRFVYLSGICPFFLLLSLSTLLHFKGKYCNFTFV